MAFKTSTLRIWINLFIFGFNVICNIYPAFGNNDLNERPIIAIPAMSITDELLLEKVKQLKGRQYVASSYVKFIEMAGARVVPIPSKVNDTVLEHIFNSVNGVLFPGGEINLKDSGYYKITKKLFKLAIDENEKGNVFPILGICRGMQAMIVHTEGSIDIMDDTDSVNYTTTLKWNDKNFDKSFVKDMPPPMKESASKKDITSHFHKYGIAEDVFSDGKVGERFEVVATSKDRNGKEFVSIFQGKNLPFYGIQFHPEKVLFEWAETVNIPHSLEAVYFSQFFSNAFMADARKNTNHFKNNELERFSTSKDQTYYTGFLPESHSPFLQIYLY